MLFKYFLDYLPEEVNLIDPSLLTVFRRQGASALFLANIKRIIKLKEEKVQNNG